MKPNAPETYPESHQRTSLMTMKGIAFANVRAFVISSYGEHMWSKTLEALSPDDQLQVQASVAVGWYDVKLFARLLRAVDAVCGSGDLSLLKKVGAFEAEQDFNRVVRLFIRAVSPSAIFRIERRLWKHFQSAGSWELVETPQGMNAVLTGWAVDQALCVELAGYLARLVAFSGGRCVTVQHPECVARGGARCLFQHRWIE